VPGARPAVFDDHPRRRTQGWQSDSLPFFYRKKTGANGEIDEVSLGPSVVRVFRWIALIIVAALLTFGSTDSWVLFKLLLRLFP